MFKKILAYALTVCLLISATVVPAYAVDGDVPFDDSFLSAPIYYTDGYYPGLIAEQRESAVFVNRVAHGSYSTMNYNPTFSLVGTAGVSHERGDFNSLVPSVIADSFDVSAVYTFADFVGDRVIVQLPSTSDCYFDFQSSNFLFDQQSADANTFYVNGDLTFSIRNLWSFNTTAWYLASDPLAVQFVIDGQAYGDIIDVTGYTSPFTDLYNGGIPATATVTFDNLKVYYQGDTPDMVGFRVYTGSAFVDGSYMYNLDDDIVASNTITLRCSEIPDITFVQEGGEDYSGDFSGISDAISAGNTLQQAANNLLTSINTAITGLYRAFYTSGLTEFLGYNGNVLSSESQLSLTYLMRHGFLGLRSLLTDPSGSEWGQVINNALLITSGTNVLNPDGKVSTLTSVTSFAGVLRRGLLGLSANITALDTSVNASLDDLDTSLTGTLTDFDSSVNTAVDDLDSSLTGTLTDFKTTIDSSLDDLFSFGSGTVYLGTDGNEATSTTDITLSHVERRGLLGLGSLLRDFLRMPATTQYLSYDGNVVVADAPIEMQDMIRRGLMGLATLEKSAQSYVADTVFKWRSFNMDTHQLNAAANVTGQNNLFFTAFQSMEDKLGRLAYVFGSDDDLKLKEEADPGTDAFRENFGGGLSLGQIKDGADVVSGVNGLFDSGYSFGDAFTEISDESMFTMWFSAENAAAIDSTGSVMALDDSDPYNMQAYFDNFQAVTDRREKGEDD